MSRILVSVFMSREASGDPSDLRSKFRLSCPSADPCEGTAATCAARILP